MDDSYAQGIVRDAKGLPNVHLHGRVPHSEVDEFYSRAHALVLTSMFEGFPSVFLEAWSWGLPTISTVDVDGVVVDAELGAIASDVRGLADALGKVLSSRQEWESCSKRAREYYVGNHTRSETGAAMGRMLCELVGRTSSSDGVGVPSEASCTSV